MEYLRYVPPHEVAEGVRRTVERMENMSSDELWQMWLDMGLIRVMKNGEVRVPMGQDLDAEDEAWEREQAAKQAALDSHSVS